MNHWFLCARDVMWVFVAWLPLGAARASGWNHAKGKDDMNYIVCAMAMQGSILLLTYFGVIK